MRRLGIRGQLARQLALAVVGVFVMIPIWGMVYLAFDGSIGLFPHEFRVWPAKFSLEWFQQAWTDPTNGRTFLELLQVSLTVAGGAALASLILGTSMAYAYARFRFPGRDASAVVLLTGALLPPVAVMIPLYLLLSWIGIRESQLGLAVAYASFSMPLAVWLMRAAFRAIPREVEESAYLDGASAFRSFRAIALPLALPSLLTASLVAFLLGYSEFAIGWLFVSHGGDITLAMAVAANQFGYSQKIGIVSALSLLMAVPVVAIFLALQRVLLRDLSIGAAAE